MGQFQQSVLTEKGAQLLAATQTGGKLIVRTLAFGDGVGTGGLDTYKSLVSEKQRVNVGANYYLNGADLSVWCELNGALVTEGYYLREMGIYVADPTAPDNPAKDILYAVSRVVAGDTGLDYFIYIAPFGDSMGVRVKPTMHTIVSPKAVISVEGNVLEDYVKSVNDKGPDASGNVKLTYLDVGAAAGSHTHTLASLGAAAASHSHTAAEVGAATSGHTHTPVSIGAAAASHSHTETLLKLGYSASATGSGNAIAIGYNATANSSSYNAATSMAIAIGKNVYSNHSGSYSGIAIGSDITGAGISIGSNCVSGSMGVAVGQNARSQDGTGVAIGFSATTAGSGTVTAGVAIGHSANVSSANGIAIGLLTNSGFAGAAIGYGARALGNYATALGSSANASGANSTAIGAGATVATDNTMQLGNATNLSALQAKVNLTLNSDERDKADIELVEKGLDFINRIYPISYVYNQRLAYMSEVADEDDILGVKKDYRNKYGLFDYDREAHAQGLKKGERRRIGVSAQDVREALISVYGTADYANLVNNNLHDDVHIPANVENQLSVSYPEFIPFLISAIQELTIKVESLEGAVYG